MWKRKQQASANPININVKRQESQKRPASTSSDRVYKPECFFCGKDKYILRNREPCREKLTHAKDLTAGKTLRDLAVTRQDEKLLAVTSRDIVGLKLTGRSSMIQWPN